MNSPNACAGEERITLAWHFTGAVQGVGFRPFVARNARSVGVRGWVRNRRGGVEVVAAGSRTQLMQLEAILTEFDRDQVAIACRTQELAPSTMVPDFRILPSADDHDVIDHIPLDRGLCDACEHEMQDIENRRYGYAMIGCAACGPRYAGLIDVPFDRERTVFASFGACPECLAEYGDPGNRRFHAQTIACANCGPAIYCYQGDRTLLRANEALEATAKMLRNGAIVAVKGVGGYHLLCHGGDQHVVERLRRRKHRLAQPFAVMFTVEQLEHASDELVISKHEWRALRDGSRPLVLLQRREVGEEAAIASNVAPGLSRLGVLLPYTGSHLALLRSVGAPLVATSANLSGQPMPVTERAAEHALRGIADGFLHHNREIVRRVDDSVVYLSGNRRRVLRLGRGESPLELTLPARLRKPLLAVGGHQRNSIALAWDKRVVVSPHIGNLSSVAGLDAFKELAEQLQTLYRVSAETIVCDAHPGYASTLWAKRQPIPTIQVFHHIAHAETVCYGCAEIEKTLVFAWDGTGLGQDGTLWGGEALIAHNGGWKHFASIRPFRLPGGEMTARQPWRIAAALLWSECKDVPLNWNVDLHILRQAWRAGINSPWCSSVGRLFDAASVILGLVRETSYDGEAAMRLECAAAGEIDLDSGEWPMTCDEHGVWRSDWQSVLPMLCESPLTLTQRAQRFHGALVNVIKSQAHLARQLFGVRRVGLAGGVFQNALLMAGAEEQLLRDGFEVLNSPPVPINDGGLALGQVLHVSRWGTASFADANRE